MGKGTSGAAPSGGPRRNRGLRVTMPSFPDLRRLFRNRNTDGDPLDFAQSFVQAVNSEIYALRLRKVESRSEKQKKALETLARVWLRAEWVCQKNDLKGELQWLGKSIPGELRPVLERLRQKRVRGS